MSLAVKLNNHQFSDRKISDQRGFTIIELMIALSVLSVLLVMTSMTMMHIGKLYSKGLNSARVQNATREIIKDTTGMLQFGGSNPAACTINQPVVQTESGPKDAAPTCAANATTTSPAWGNVTMYSFCVDTIRYSYTIGLQVRDNPTAGQNPHALWRDTMNSNANCQPLDLTTTSPGGPSDSATVAGSGVELVPDRMTLTDFFIYESPSDSGIYEVTIGLAYGDHDLLQVDDNGVFKCAGQKGQEYCGVSFLKTVVTRRLK